MRFSLSPSTYIYILTCQRETINVNKKIMTWILLFVTITVNPYLMNMWEVFSYLRRDGDLHSIPRLHYHYILTYRTLNLIELHVINLCFFTQLVHKVQLFNCLKPTSLQYVWVLSLSNLCTSIHICNSELYHDILL